MNAVINTNVKAIYLKLGCECNLHCSYCHAEHKVIIFNPDILPVLKSLKLNKIVFGGGEPFLYWDIIKKIVLYLGDSIKYCVVTNGTLLTQEIVNFCNGYNFKIFVSLDGYNTTRDTSKPVRWDLIKQLKTTGTAVTFYRENQNIRKTLSSLNKLKERYLTLPATIYSSFPNFVHSTKKTGIITDKALADSYISQMTELIDEAFQLYKKGDRTPLLETAFMRFVKVKGYNGIKCCNDKNISLLCDGTICSCPYTFEKTGDIFHLDEIDWNQVKSKYSRKDCSTCELFDVCGNFCCINITDDECYIMKKLHKNVKILMDKYKVTYNELDKAIYG